LTACGASETSPASTPAKSAATAVATATVAPSPPAPPAVASAAPPPAAASAVPVAPPRAPDTLGGVAEGSLDTDVVKALGKPPKAPPPHYDMATGDYVSTWVYPAKGISISMWSKEESGPFKVELMHVYGMSVKTNEGIGLGASVDDVMKAYGAAIDKETSKDGVIGIGPGGEEPDGLAFLFDPKTNKVRWIILGRDWEGWAGPRGKGP